MSNQQIMDWMRIVGLTECLIGAVLVVVLYLMRKMMKRIWGMSAILLTIAPEEDVARKLRILADRAGLAMRGEKRDDGK